MAAVDNKPFSTNADSSPQLLVCVPLRGGFKDLVQVFTDAEPRLLLVSSRLGPAVGWTLATVGWSSSGLLLEVAGLAEWRRCYHTHHRNPDT